MRNAPLLIAAALLTSTAPAIAATRNVTVTDFDRIRVEGPYQVSLSTSRAPSARVEGSSVALDSVVVEVQGRTLVIRPNRGAWGGYPGRPVGLVSVTAGTHDLTDATVAGTGSLAIDRVKGLSFNAVAQGAGSLSIADVRADKIAVALVGASSATLGGKVLALNAVLRGSGLLDASALQAKDAVLGLEGAGEIRASASNTATISANGPGRISLSGRPACAAKGNPTAVITGCR